MVSCGRPMPSMNAASKAGMGTLVFFFAKHREISTRTDPKISSILATFFCLARFL